jgi:hypothetical protein
MVELKIGKKIVSMRLLTWSEGSALLPLVEDAVPATSPAERKIIDVRPDGRVLRQFPPRVAPAAFDRRHQ